MERLEKLVLDREDKIVFNFDEKRIIENGFAIILTNEMMYWSKNDAYGHERNLSDSPYKVFYSFDGEKIGRKDLGKDQLEKNYSGKQRSSERTSSIFLSKKYAVQWLDYKLENFTIETSRKSRKDYNFRYLIYDINHSKETLPEKSKQTEETCPK